jgi:hypothetical protein
VAMIVWFKMATTQRGWLLLLSVDFEFLFCFAYPIIALIVSPSLLLLFPCFSLFAHIKTDSDISTF